MYVNVKFCQHHKRPFCSICIQISKLIKYTIFKILFLRKINKSNNYKHILRKNSIKQAKEWIFQVNLKFYISIFFVIEYDKSMPILTEYMTQLGHFNCTISCSCPKEWTDSYSVFGTSNATFRQIRRNVVTWRQKRRLTGRWRVKKMKVDVRRWHSTWTFSFNKFSFDCCKTV